MADTLITPTAGSLAGLGYVVRAITIGLVLSSFAPIVHSSANDASRAPTVGSLSLTGQIPTVTNSNLSVTRAPTPGALTLTGQAPTIPLTNVSLMPDVGALSLLRDTFPTTPLLDLFDRADENPVNTNWDVLQIGFSECRIVSNVLRAAALSGSYSYWATSNFGPDSEIYATVAQRPATGDSFALYVRIVSPNSASLNGYKAYFKRSATANSLTVWLMRITGNNETFLGTFTDITSWADADQIGLSVTGSSLKAWHRPNASVWRILAQVSDSTYINSGNIGVQIWDFTTSGTALDNLGGGTRLQPPDAPYVQPNIGLRLTGYAPILLNAGSIRKDTLVGTLTLTGLNATVTTTQPIALTPGTGSLTLTTFLGGVFGGSFVVTPGVASLQLQSTQQITPSTATALKCQPWAEIRWLANTESDLAGYKVYHGIVSGTYIESVTLGLVLTYTWNNLPSGTNYFVVTALDVVGNESTPSAEVSTVISGSGFAPTLTNSSPAVRIPTTGALTFTGLAPSIQAYQVPTTGALTLTGAVPILGRGIVVPPGALTFTGLAIVATGAFTDTPSAGALVLTGLASTVLEQGTFTIRPGVGSLVLNGLAPTVPAAWQASLAINANQVLDAGGSPLDA